ncbi:cytochrome bd-I oxidase subunit CydX [Azospirillum thermophilum]|uniref:Cytochrome bd-I oxidase subunit CydX n=1 Tax=Azospirillum thermophilum TaxID=2202148 RepID=A0A2S2CKD6_9PROT|nr:cytochrome bd-I oxidase subunit CydX [Azospirillum thermophilum]AWK84963.1 cytochrome bd-I oxidase subunit CydX [Azospirillum thermophilum]
MWYFTWVLGLTAALSLGIINVLWLEAEDAVQGRTAGRT